MTSLITYQAGFGMPSFSPFCVKSIWMLNAAGVAWTRVDAKDPRKYAHAKLPVLDVGSGLIHDSNRIRAHLEAQGADFWGDTSQRDRAFGHSLIRMAEDHMYFHLVMERWLDDAVWPDIRDTYFDAVPKLLRGMVTGGLRKKLRAGLAAQGLGRMSTSEKTARLEEDLAAIKDLLAQSTYLLGDTPTLPDFSVAAVLGCMRRGPVQTALVARVSGDPVLMGYVDRMDEAFS